MFCLEDIFWGNSKVILAIRLLFTITDELDSNPVKTTQFVRISRNWLSDTQVPRLLLYPTQEQAFCITPDVFYTPGSQEQWPPSHKAPTPAPVNPSTKPPSTDHILPAEPDKTWPRGSLYKMISFQEKNTCCHIFPHRMCLHFRIFSVLVVIFHYNGDRARSFNTAHFCMIMAAFSCVHKGRVWCECGCSLLLSSQ